MDTSFPISNAGDLHYHHHVDMPNLAILLFLYQPSTNISITAYSHMKGILSQPDNSHKSGMLVSIVDSFSNTFHIKFSDFSPVSTNPHIVELSETLLYSTKKKQFHGSQGETKINPVHHEYDPIEKRTQPNNIQLLQIIF